MKHSRFLGATLIIAGVNIGVGMLALPLVTAQEGFFPAVVLYGIAYFFMTILARLILEACSWLPLGANLISICSTFLGTPGAIFCGVIYLFLFYCLLIAHIAAGGDAVFQFADGNLSHWMSTSIYFLLFAPTVYFGTAAVDRLNMFLMGGVVLSFVVFGTLAMPHVHWELLERHNWEKITIAFPAVLGAFGFQNLVPTLYTYTGGDHRMMRKAIWIGTSIPLLFYILWEIWIIGIVPESNLLQAKMLGQSAGDPLRSVMNGNIVSLFADLFSALAMTTSFMGMSIAFFDFWADALQWKKEGIYHVLLTALVFFIPLLAVFINPKIFIFALNLAGGIGEILLYGILPVLFVFSGRYLYKKSRKIQFVPGGKPALFLILLFSISTFITFFM